MKLIFAAYVTLASHTWPNCTSEAAWCWIKRLCARRAAYWMSLARYAEALAETEIHIELERQRYEFRALAAVGETGSAKNPSSCAPGSFEVAR